MEENYKADVMEKLVSLCKRRGYIFQSSEVYGGINSCYDYGPMGIELKRNIKEFWWKRMVHFNENIEGIDASILMHPKVWEASGHVEAFTDPLVDCKKCKNRFREDELKTKNCPKCGGELTESRQFNLMFKTFMGPVESDSNVVYLRPETAQGIYVNFLNVLNSSRQKIPFGIAQIGKAFRNEITPGNFIFRTREFEQMEMQFFIDPETDRQWMDHWKEERMKWHQDLGLKKDKIRFHEHGPTELAHYAKEAYDVQFLFPFGWQEIEGIHNRTNFDLTRHTQFSGKKLQYFDEVAKKNYTPFIIETSVGCDRTLLALLVDAYDEEAERTVMRIPAHIAPVKAAVFPLINKEGMPEVAEKIYKKLMQKFNVFLDTSGAIGRRYRRQDEVGTPFCITVDNETLTNNSITLRERDKMTQERISIDELESVLYKKTTL